jgi:hypothetical protein
MIEGIFAFIFGFALVATLVGALWQEDALSSILTKAMIALVSLAAFGFFNLEFGNPVKEFMLLVFNALSNDFYFLLGGGVCAVAWALYRDGSYLDWWSSLHPQSAPTDFARAGKPSDFTSRKSFSSSSTLIGTSTPFLMSEFDLRTQTLVKLAYFAFSDTSARTLSFLEGALGASNGKRQKELQRLVAGIRARPDLRRTVHPYWRAINGNHAAARKVFGDLCQLAKQTGNRDPKTIERLMRVGLALRLSHEDMGRAIALIR